jgi:hypothetical protein
MATVRYVSHSGSNTAPYDTWAKAATALLTATALMGAGDTTYVDSTQAEALAATTTYTIAGTAAAPAMIICTSDLVNMPPLTRTTGATFTEGSGAWSVVIAGTFYMYGCSFAAGVSASVANVNVGQTAGNYQVFESCGLQMKSTAAAGLFHMSNPGARVKTINCTITLPNLANAQIQVGGEWVDEGSTVLPTTTQPTNVFGAGSASTGNIFLQGTDLSAFTNALFGDNTTQTSTAILTRCKLASGVAIISSLSTGASKNVYLFDCAYGNIQYAFAHYNYFGNTVAQVSIYENEQAGGDGAFYDLAKDPIGWTVTGVNGTWATPYVSPWIDMYTEDNTAITPRFEIARDGSTTAWNNDQVWSEWSYKGTAAVVTATLDQSDRWIGVGATAAQGNSSKVIGNWTGLSATYKLMVLQPSAAITPAVIGDMRGRVCVAGANTVYVNPKILGL